MKRPDLSKLTKEQKLEMLALLEEKDKRTREKREAYKPNAGQLPIHMSDATIKFCASANGAGKTCAAVHEAIWACQGYHPIKKTHTKVPADVAVVLDKPDKADSVWLKEMMQWFVIKPDQLHKKGKPNTTQISFDNGSTITFFSHEQDPLTFESIQLDYVIYDEPPPLSVFIGMRRATRKKGSKPWHLIIGTPLAQPWLRTQIWEPWMKGELPEAECFRMGTEVNKDNINYEEQKKNFKFMTDKERAIRERGEFFDLDGLALAHLWRDDVHVITPKELNWQADYPCVVIVDPHPSKAHVALLMGADRDNRLYVLAEYSEKAIARKFTQSLIQLGWFHNHRVIDIVYDSLGSADTTSGEGFRSFGEVMNEELKKSDIGQARATRYDEKNDEDFIERIRDSLAVPDEPDSFGKCVPKLRVVAGCNGTVLDIRNVQWMTDRNKENKPKLDISNTDRLACIKYGLATNLNFQRKKDKIYYRTAPAYGIKPKVIKWARAGRR